jgi:hypothetical protein
MPAFLRVGALHTISALLYYKANTATAELVDNGMFSGVDHGGDPATLAEWARPKASSFCTIRGLPMQAHAGRFHLVLVRSESNQVQVYQGVMDIRGFRWKMTEHLNMNDRIRRAAEGYRNKPDAIADLQMIVSDGLGDALWTAAEAAAILNLLSEGSNQRRLCAAAERENPHA